MGILRTDRVTGLGGANAIKGSVNFNTGRNKPIFLKIASDDFAVGTGDFTVEAWYYRGGLGTHDDAVGNIILQTGNTPNSQNGIWLADAQGKLEGRVHYGSGSWNLDITSSSTMVNNRWYHVAMSRSGSTVRIFLDGALEASGSSSSDLTTAYSNEAYVGAQGNSTGNRGIIGFISNARISNAALYTAAFTVPTTRLEKLSSTLLLCCQSPGNVLQEETGKIVETFVDNTNNHGPQASRFTPNSPVGFSTTTDVGTQFGSTFDGVTTFDSQAYFVPPGGNTRERNRGRGVLGGGAPYVSPSVINNMSYHEVQSQGNFQDFGDLTLARGNMVSGQNASSTRGLSSGGWTNPAGVNTIDFITIANTANAIDFGDTTITRPNGGLSNQTRSLTASSGDLINTIDFVTIATTGNASDFGDLLDARGLVSGVSSPTRGVFGGGRNNTPSSNTEYNTLQFITIASTGNAQDFGDLTRTRYGMSGFSSATRGIFAGGYSNPQGKWEGIEFFTIATLGNATDFGDLSASQGYGGSLTNTILGLITINNPSNYYNTIEFITISTTGNALDFGDADPLGSGKGHGSFPSCMSDSHGGTT